jgi:hypothetical protein
MSWDQGSEARCLAETVERNSWGALGFEPGWSISSEKRSATTILMISYLRTVMEVEKVLEEEGRWR